MKRHANLLPAGAGRDRLAESIIHCSGHRYVVTRLGPAHACKLDQRESLGRIAVNCMARAARTPLVFHHVAGGLLRRRRRRLLKNHLLEVHFLLVFVEHLPLVLALLPIALRDPSTLEAELPVEEKSDPPSQDLQDAESENP